MTTSELKQYVIAEAKKLVKAEMLKENINENKKITLTFTGKELRVLGDALANSNFENNIRGTQDWQIRLSALNNIKNNISNAISKLHGTNDGLDENGPVDDYDYFEDEKQRVEDREEEEAIKRAMMSDRDIASSDRLDYAREKVRSGQWDDTQRQEFLRGA